MNLERLFVPNWVSLWWRRIQVLFPNRIRATRRIGWAVTQQPVPAWIPMPPSITARTPVSWVRARPYSLFFDMSDSPRVPNLCRSPSLPHGDILLMETTGYSEVEVAPLCYRIWKGHPIHIDFDRFISNNHILELVVLCGSPDIALDEGVCIAEFTAWSRDTRQDAVRSRLDLIAIQRYKELT